MVLNISEEIIGERIIIKKPEVNFALAKEMFNLIKESQNELLPWLDWPVYYSKPEQYLIYMNDKNNEWEKQSSFTFIIFNKETNQPMGSCSLITLSDFVMEIGYWLGTKFTGKGYIQEAIKLLELEFLKNPELERLQVVCEAENKRSKNTIEKAGYIFEGTLRCRDINKELGRKGNDCYFSKIRSDFKQR